MLTRHRCDKGVTPTRIVGDEPPARAAVAKRFAQRRDMDPERTVVDDRIGPRAGDEPILVDRLAGAFDQRIALTLPVESGTAGVPTWRGIAKAEVGANGNPSQTDPLTRALERESSVALGFDVIRGGDNLLSQALADQAEQSLLHMVSADPNRTPNFILFGNPDYFFTTSGKSPPPACTPA